jgi:hypothetical protein
LGSGWVVAELRGDACEGDEDGETGYNRRVTRALFVRRLLLFGALVTISGIGLYSQLDRIDSLNVSLAIYNGAAILSLALTVIGLLTILMSAAIWSWRAPLRNLLRTGIGTGLATFLLAELLLSKFRGYTLILTFVVCAGSLGCIWIFLTAAVRGLRLRKGN